MRILVAGALGEVGRTVAAALASGGHETVAASSRAPLAGPGVLTLEDAADLVASGRIDLVVNASGRGDWRPGDRPGTNSTDVLAPAIVASAVPAVLVSTLRVLEGYTGSASEDSPALVSSAYAKANAEGEDRWLSECGPSGCVLRIANYLCAPSGLHSPQAHLLPWSLVTEAWETGSIAIRSGPLTERVFVSATDVASALELLSSERPLSRICATVPGMLTTLADLVDMTGDAFIAAGLPRPEATFGTQSQSPWTMEPGWLSHHGWSCELNPVDLSGVIAQWLKAVVLD